MPPWLYNTIIFFNVVVLFYFLLGNGIYTYLLLLSLRSTWLQMHRRAYVDLDGLRKSPLAPPVTIIIPAWNEQDVIVDAVLSALQVDYPKLQVIVVDDGSTDLTLERLVRNFALAEMDGAYRATLPTLPVRAFYQNPEIPNLLVVSKERGGKPDALNTGINLCRTPYFCNLDADCLLERDALLVSCSCSYHLAAEELTGLIQSAGRHAGRFVQILYSGGQAPDHPVHPAIPETRYLKAFFCRVTRE